MPPYRPVHASEVTEGWDTLTALEGVETRREGIFVMPTSRITIHSTYTCATAEVEGGKHG